MAENLKEIYNHAKDFVKQNCKTGLVYGLLGASSFGFLGCKADTDFVQEVFRYNDEKNMAPLVKPVEIDYTDYDKEKDFKIINDRAHLRKEEVKPILEKIVDVPSPTKYRIPAINASYIEDGNDGIILQYRSRLPAPDLVKLIGEYLGKEIKINTHENTMVFSGKKENFGDFRNLTNLLNEFDLPEKQIRINLSIVEYFNDNTYDRELVLSILKDSMNLAHLNLPSLPDPTVELTTGIDINPFYNHTPDKYTLEGAIKFLDSYGKTKTLSSVDLFVSNGKPANFKNVSSIPYPEAIVAGTVVVDAINYRDTGTTVQMTPFANEEGFITIKLPKAESGEQTGFIGTLQRPTFRTADFGSEFIVRNGVTYILATSLFTRYKEVERGLPGINKIPVLGHLFSSKSIENSQSQLLYFIEARIMDRNILVGTGVKRVKEEVPPVLEEIERPGVRRIIEKEKPSVIEGLVEREVGRGLGKEVEKGLEKMAEKGRLVPGPNVVEPNSVK